MKTNTHGLIMKGIRKACGETKDCGRYDSPTEIIYNYMTGEISIQNCNERIAVEDPEITIIQTSQHMSMQQIADAIYQRVLAYANPYESFDSNGKISTTKEMDCLFTTCRFVKQNGEKKNTKKRKKCKKTTKREAVAATKREDAAATKSEDAAAYALDNFTRELYSIYDQVFNFAKQEVEPDGRWRSVPDDRRRAAK